MSRYNPVLVRLENPVLSSNTYVIKHKGDAVIIDCGDISLLTGALDSLCVHNKNVRGLFVTHAHIDHIYGLSDFSTLYPECKIFISECAKHRMHNPKYTFAAYHGIKFSFNGSNLIVVDDSTIVHALLKDFDIQCIHTPGHDDGCMTYIIDKYIFTGDSYIPGLKTVTSLRGNKLQALESETRIKQLIADHSLTICPGHGDIV